MIIELNLKNSKTVKNSTANPPKRQPVNLSETSGDTASVHQRAVYIKEQLTLYKVFNVSSFCHNLTDPLSVMTD